MSALTESQNVEWKESWHDKYLQWVCGFANAQGGELYIGVNDAGEVVGVDNAKRLLEDIPNKIQTTMDVVASVDLLTEGEKEYIRITVKPSIYPVSYKGGYHYRSGSTKQQLTGLALTQFLMGKAGLHWEDEPIDGVSVDDLDKESFDIFRREALRRDRMSAEDLAVTNEQLLESLDLLAEDGRLTRAAILLFHRHPERWVRENEIRIGRFHGDTDLRFQDEIGGSLMLQADRVIDVIFEKYLYAEVSYDVDVRVETYPYAREALREAVYNALMHSDRMQRNATQIWVGDDILYISDNRPLTSEWTVEQLQGHHKSVPTNPHIANAFYRAGYVERWGRGIRKMAEECRKHGNKPPEIMLGRGDFTLKFEPLFAMTLNAPVYVGGNGEGNVAKDPTINPTINPTITEQRVLAAIREDPSVVQRVLAERLGMSRSSVADHTANLQEKGLLRREGSRKSGHWIVLWSGEEDDE